MSLNPRCCLDSCCPSGIRVHYVQYVSLSPFVGINPLEARSARFVLPSTCLHCAGFVISWIIDSRFATNVLNLVVVFWMHRKTVIESHQKYTRSAFIFISRSIISGSLAATTAPHNSKRGIVTSFIGASRDFPINEIFCVPSASKFFRYATAPYATSAASEK